MQSLAKGGDYFPRVNEQHGGGIRKGFDRSSHGFFRSST